jgi:hypothetical protein
MSASACWQQLTVQASEGRWTLADLVPISPESCFGLGSPSSGLEEKPAAPLRLIDEVLKKACGRHIAGIISERMESAHMQNKCLLVFVQFAQHVVWRDEVRVIVGNSLKTRDMSDGADRGAAKLPGPFSEVISHGKELIAMVVQQQVVVAKMRAAHVPVKVLSLEVEGKDIRNECVEASADLAD